MNTSRHGGRNDLRPQLHYHQSKYLAGIASVLRLCDDIEDIPPIDSIQLDLIGGIAGIIETLGSAGVGAGAGPIGLSLSPIPSDGQNLGISLKCFSGDHNGMVHTGIAHRHIVVTLLTAVHSVGHCIGVGGIVAVGLLEGHGQQTQSRVGVLTVDPDLLCVCPGQQLVTDLEEKVHIPLVTEIVVSGRRAGVILALAVGHGDGLVVAAGLPVVPGIAGQSRTVTHGDTDVVTHQGGNHCHIHRLLITGNGTNIVLIGHIRPCRGRLIQACQSYLFQTNQLVILIQLIQGDKQVVIQRHNGQGVLPVDIVFIIGLGVNDHPDLNDITVRHIVVSQCSRPGHIGIKGRCAIRFELHIGNLFELLSGGGGNAGDDIIASIQQLLGHQQGKVVVTHIHRIDGLCAEGRAHREQCGSEIFSVEGQGVILLLPVQRLHSKLHRVVLGHLIHFKIPHLVIGRVDLGVGSLHDGSHAIQIRLCRIIRIQSSISCSLVGRSGIVVVSIPGDLVLLPQVIHNDRLSLVGRSQCLGFLDVLLVCLGVVILATDVDSSAHILGLKIHVGISNDIAQRILHLIAVLKELHDDTLHLIASKQFSPAEQVFLLLLAAVLILNSDTGQIGQILLELVALLICNDERAGLVLDDGIVRLAIRIRTDHGQSGGDGLVVAPHTGGPLGFL